MPETALSIGGLRFRLRLPVLPRTDREIAPFVIEPGGACDVAVDYRPDASLSDEAVTLSPDGNRVTVDYPPRCPIALRRSAAA